MNAVDRGVGISEEEARAGAPGPAGSLISTAPLYQFTDCPSSETSRQQVSPPCPRTPPPVVLWGRKLLQSTPWCSPHPSNASAEMSAEAVLALIDAFCGTLGSKILGSILDQPSRSLLCGRRFMASSFFLCTRSGSNCPQLRL